VGCDATRGPHEELPPVVTTIPSEGDRERTRAGGREQDEHSQTQARQRHLLAGGGSPTVYAHVATDP
jgi:hypothetical protein